MRLLISELIILSTKTSGLPKQMGKYLDNDAKKLQKKLSLLETNNVDDILEKWDILKSQYDAVVQSIKIVLKLKRSRSQRIH